ncbi:putative Ig domain-containing protein [Pedobacter sp. UBA4863]|uniref:NHL domain-containing protein n=1 Tax=Pedobacter sp. UBA4863 TaxID=1947060 RepID=UPI0025ED9F02|nr:putative Ig domain-containing protein [Pedobacter sp. UBA4863]
MKEQNFKQKSIGKFTALLIVGLLLTVSSCMKQKDTLLGTPVRVELPPTPVDPNSDLSLTYQNPIILNVGEYTSPITPTLVGNVYPEVIPNYIITLFGKDVVGTAHGPYPLDVMLAFPIGLTVDDTGAIFVTEDGGGVSDRIRKLSPSGDIRSNVFVGGNTAAFTDGLGTNASFFSPLDIAIHPITGDFYVTDNNRIRKVTKEGLVTTFAGSKEDLVGAIDDRPEDSRFAYLTCITFDKHGNIYVGDRDNGSIRKYDATTDSFSTFAGPINGRSLTSTDRNKSLDGTGNAARFNSPQGITIDDDGNLYVIDRNSDVIRKVTPTGVVTTFAGGKSLNKVEDGNGTNASFSDPWRIAWHKPTGDLYVSEWNGGALRKITPNGDVTTIAGNGIEPTASIDGVGSNATIKRGAGITVAENGNVYFAQRTGAVRMLTKAGFSIKPALPAGLTFDVYTGAISGTPSQATPRTTYTVTAYNGRGEAVNTTDFFLTVQ